MSYAGFKFGYDLDEILYFLKVECKKMGLGLDFSEYCLFIELFLNDFL